MIPIHFLPRGRKNVP